MQIAMFWRTSRSSSRTAASRFGRRGVDMKRSQAKTVSLEEALKKFNGAMTSGIPPTRHVGGQGDVANIQAAPHRRPVLGGPPGVGKTALTLQLGVDAVRNSPELTACFFSVETTVEEQVARTVSRLSKISFSDIMARDISESPENYQKGLAT